MKDILEWLSGYHGEKHQQKRCIEWEQAINKEVELYNRLEERLDKEGGILLKEFAFAKDCAWDFEVVDYYKIGFKAGMQLARELGEIE